MNKLKGRKQRIMCLWGMGRTIDNLGYDSAEHTQLFFDSLQNMEKAYNAKTDITFIAENNDAKTKELLQNILSRFRKANFDDRISACLYRSDLLENCRQKHEKSSGSISFCLYAGSTLADKEIALEHLEGSVFTGIPGTFVDTNGFINSFSFQNSKAKNIPPAGKPAYNYEALMRGFDYLADNAKTTENGKISC